MERKQIKTFMKISSQISDRWSLNENQFIVWSRVTTIFYAIHGNQIFHSCWFIGICQVKVLINFERNRSVIKFMIQSLERERGIESKSLIESVWKMTSFNNWQFRCSHFLLRQVDVKRVKKFPNNLWHFLCLLWSIGPLMSLLCSRTFFSVSFSQALIECFSHVKLLVNDASAARSIEEAIWINFRFILRSVLAKNDFLVRLQLLWSTNKNPFSISKSVYWWN